MKRKFTKVGNSWAMLFTKTMIEMLDINPETEFVEIEFDKKMGELIELNWINNFLKINIKYIIEFN